MKYNFTNIIEEYINSENKTEDMAKDLVFLSEDITLDKEHYNLLKGLFTPFEKEFGTDNTKAYVHSVIMSFFKLNLHNSFKYYQKYIDKFEQEIRAELLCLINEKAIKEFEKKKERELFETKLKKYISMVHTKYLSDSYTDLKQFYGSSILKINKLYNFDIKSLAKVYLHSENLECNEKTISNFISMSIFKEYITSDLIADYFMKEYDLSEVRFYHSMNRVKLIDKEYFESNSKTLINKEKQKEEICLNIYNECMKNIKEGREKKIKFTSLDYNFLYGINPSEVAKVAFKHFDLKDVNLFRSTLDTKYSNQKISIDEALKMNYKIQNKEASNEDVSLVFEFLKENNIEPLTYNFGILIERKINNVPFLPFEEEKERIKRYE